MHAQKSRLLAVIAILALAATTGAIADPGEELQLFLRAAGTECASKVYTLQTEAGTGESICGYVGGGPFGEVFTATGSDQSQEFRAVGIDALQLDATRDATGIITVAPYVGVTGDVGSGVGQVRVDLTLKARLAGKTQTLGTQTVEVMANPVTSRQSIPFTIDLPESVDGLDATSVSLVLLVRGAHVGHGFAQANGASHLTLPLLPDPDPSD